CLATTFIRHALGHLAENVISVVHIGSLPMSIHSLDLSYRPPLRGLGSGGRTPRRRREPASALSRPRTLRAHTQDAGNTGRPHFKLDQRPASRPVRWGPWAVFLAVYKRTEAAVEIL